jgi:TonB-dependent SusC/RagA subfamily outer membrane receptor
MMKNLLIMLMLFCYGVQAQVRAITGVVSDATGALPGANVVVKGTNNGVQTDFDGKYTIQAKASDFLAFSFIGCKTQTVEVRQADVISITMSPDHEQQLQDGCYPPIRMRNKNSQINQTVPIPDIKRSGGEIPGLTIDPKQKNVTIRLHGKIENVPEPLYIINDEPVSVAAFRGLDPENIESIHVLKDAAATARFGCRGYGGVICITTKDGKNYDKYVKGLVTDNFGVPLKNVLVQVENWPNFELTEFDGLFSIGVNKNQTLVISDPDYNSVRIKAEQLGNRNIVLERRP